MRWQEEISDQHGWCKSPGMVCEDGTYPGKRGWHPSSGYCKTGSADFEYPSNHSNHLKIGKYFSRIEINFGKTLVTLGTVVTKR